MLFHIVRLAAQVTDPITRDGARDAARHELSKHIYQQSRPNPVQQAIQWVIRQISELIDRAARVVPGGIPALIAMLVVVVLLVIGLRLGLGPTGVRDALTDRRRGASVRTAADYRDEADALAASGHYREAIRARLRASIRELEQRGVLEAPAGRTADEIAHEAGATVPAISADIHLAATLFDEVWYGGHPAGAADYDRMRAIDERIRDARLVTV